MQDSKVSSPHEACAKLKRLSSFPSLFDRASACGWKLVANLRHVKSLYPAPLANFLPPPTARALYVLRNVPHFCVR
eukprot:1414680-Rhodomonas_salina.1